MKSWNSSHGSRGRSQDQLRLLAVFRRELNARVA
jgi:hypothetical protein